MYAMGVGFCFHWASSTLLTENEYNYVHWLIIAALAMSFVPQNPNIHSSPLIAACDYNHPQVALLLIKHGANINYQDGVCNDYH